MDEVRPSEETIRRYREMKSQNAFNRPIQKRTPLDFMQDRLVLECGHTLDSNARMIDLYQVEFGAYPCEACEKEWMKQQR